jgi:ATP-binding cassette subfamily B protein
MDSGDIVETGNHRELLAQDGVYADIYNSQFAQVAITAV